MIKAIFFDSGDVLMKEGFASGIRQYEKRYSLPEGKLYEAAHDRPYWREFTLGNITEEDYLKNVAENLDGKLDKEEFKKLILNDFTPNDELIDYIRRTLQGRYVLGVISNNPKEWFEYFFSKFGWNEIFEVKAVSGIVHIRKPDPNIFEYALQKAKVKGNESVYVDNRHDRIQGAQAVGMNVCIYENMKRLKDEFIKLGVI